ncbi:MAG: hypothetical protein ACHQJ6_05715 [Candidatus Berkiellales bacterium]
MLKNIKILLSLLLLLLLTSFSLSLFANPPLSIPDLLVPWKGWVLKGHEGDLCPVPYNNGAEHLCVWPSTLALTANDTKIQFSQKGVLYVEGWMPIPGDNEHWPQNVKVNGKLFSISSHEDLPALFLPPGKYSIEGEFVFDHLPDYVQIPSNCGALTLSLNGKSIAQPERDEVGKVWFRRPVQAEKPKEVNQLNVKVFRLIQDEIPIIENTLLRLNVSGQIREERLGPVLSAQALPLEVNSPLPTRLDEQGILRIQVRPGEWEILIRSRFVGEQKQLQLSKHASPWPQEEIWSFQPQNDLRLVDIEGGVSIDPKQTDMPDGWRQYPAYLLKPGSSLKLIEKRRGQQPSQAEQVDLKRRMWLDFSGKGFTVEDSLTGKISSHWRLSQNPPYLLEHVELDGQDKLITQLDQNAPPGVEIRQGMLHLLGVSRVKERPFRFPAVGWDMDVQSLATELYLPPGWMLLGAWGVDTTTHAWVQSWTLLDFFLVLIFATATLKLLGLRWGIVALITLTLIYQEPHAPIFSWLNLAAIYALLTVLPVGRARKWSLYYFWASFAVLVIIAVPFMVQQVRTAIYPQLAPPNSYPIAVSARATMAQALTVPGTMKEAVKMPKQKLRPLMKGNFLEEKQPVRPLEEYDPNAKIQTGPAIPTWHWNVYQLNWNGPVLQTQSIKLWILPSIVTSLLKWLQVILIALLVYAYARKPKQNKKDGSTSLTERSNKSLLSLFLIFILGGSFSFIPATSFADFPSDAMLGELRNRLTEGPTCLPECGEIAAMRVQVVPDQLTIRFMAHMAANTAIPLPSKLGQWMPRSVLVDNAIASQLQLDENQQLWLQLEEGVHEIVLEGPIGDQNHFEIKTPLKPKEITFEAQGWEVSGLFRHRLQGENIYFNRVQKQAENKIATPSFEAGKIPSFVILTRTFSLGVDWEIINEIQRVAPLQGAISVAIPLLKGEAPLSENVEIKDGKVFISLTDNQQIVSWKSHLKVEPTIALTALNEINIKEIWQLNASTMWHPNFEGIPFIHQQEQFRGWLPTWQPWPAEKLRINITRPQAIKGSTVTIDESNLFVIPGEHLASSTLRFAARATQGTNHSIYIPKNSALQDVLINEISQPINIKEGEIIVPINPGRQTVEIKWQTPSGISTNYRTPVVDLNLPSGNAKINLELSQDRWILFLGGPAIGPAVLFWGILVVILLVAFGLGKSGLTPLKSWEWFLLGIGLTLATPLAAIFVVAWFIVMQSRKNFSLSISTSLFQWMQIGIVLLTIAFIVSLFTSIADGLLGLPQMQLQGAYITLTDKFDFRWYQDLTANLLPRAWVLSLPMYIYRILMLLWALWLAFSLVRWLRWGWNCFSVEGYWRSENK